MRGLILLAAATAAFAGPALAADPADHAGKYWLSGVSEGDDSCNVTLGTDQVIGGWSVSLAKDCNKKFGLNDDIAAWYADGQGAIHFIDPLRKTVLKFEVVPIGGFVAERPGGEPISLDRVNNAPAPTEQDRMSGDWVLNRMGGEKVCGFVLTSNKAGTKGTLKAKPGCPTGLATATAWSVAKGKIRLMTAAAKVVLTLPGDSIEGYDGEDASGDLVGFMKDWGDQ